MLHHTVQLTSWILDQRLSRKMMTWICAFIIYERCIMFSRVQEICLEQYWRRNTLPLLVTRHILEVGNFFSTRLERSAANPPPFL
jgi:hypothetical protein